MRFRYLSQFLPKKGKLIVQHFLAGGLSNPGLKPRAIDLIPFQGIENKDEFCISILNAVLLFPSFGGVRGGLS